MRQTADEPLGIEGVWLKNRAAEAFVCTKPFLRLAIFRRRGTQSPFRLSQTDPFWGMRTWFLEPTQNNQSPLPALQPAEFRWRGPRTVRLTSAPAPEAQLQLIWDVTLGPKQAILKVRHGLKNLARKPRRLAAWAILVFPHKGVGLTPWPTHPETVPALLVFNGSHATERAIRLGDRAVGLDFRSSLRFGWVKIGVNSDSGWAGYLWPGGALKSSVAHVPGADYPEGGGTATLYSSGKTRTQGFCEVENVGPLRQVSPGRILWMDQTLELLPAPRQVGQQADGWMDAFEARRER